MYLSLSACFAALCIFFIVHYMIWHDELIKKRGVMLLVKISVFSYLWVVVSALSYYGWGSIGHFWVSCPLFMMLIMLYLHFYVGVDRSVSIRILGELVKSGSGKMNFTSIQSLYPKEYMIKHRVDTLVDNNWLVEKDGLLSCAPKGKLFAQSEIFLKKLYGLSLTG
jgi:membrane-associated HD superfamily phosphohydrolase